MNIIALDTATEACSVALLRADGNVFAEFELAPRQHNQLLPGMLDKVVMDAGLQREELNYCAYSNGPGAFTGIRIGTAQAQGIGLALGIPLVPLSTLAVIAQHRFDTQSEKLVIATIDARMGEVYWAQYQRDGDDLARLQGKEQLTSTSETLPIEGIDAIVGSGAAVLQMPEEARQQVALVEDCLPAAASMLRLAQRAIAAGGYCSASAAPINYLRNQVAVKAGAR